MHMTLKILEPMLSSAHQIFEESVLEGLLVGPFPFGRLFVCDAAVLNLLVYIYINMLSASVWRAVSSARFSSMDFVCRR